MMQIGSFLMPMMLQFGVIHVPGLKKYKKRPKCLASVTQPRSPVSLRQPTWRNPERQAMHESVHWKRVWTCVYSSREMINPGPLLDHGSVRAAWVHRSTCQCNILQSEDKQPSPWYSHCTKLCFVSSMSSTLSDFHVTFINIGWLLIDCYSSSKCPTACLAFLFAEAAPTNNSVAHSANQPSQGDYSRGSCAGGRRPRTGDPFRNVEGRQMKREMYKTPNVNEAAYLSAMRVMCKQRSFRAARHTIALFAVQ